MHATWEGVQAKMKVMGIVKAWKIHGEGAAGGWNREETEAARQVLMRDLKTSWAAAHGVVQAEGPQFWGLLIGKPPLSDFDRRRSPGALPEKLPGDDHETLWLRDGLPMMYVSQPYPLDFGTIRQMTAAALMYGLEFSISARPAWWNPGKVSFVVWRALSSPLDSID